MAKAVNNVLIRGLSGKLGGVVIRHMPDGSTWISATPDFSRRKFSKGQKAHQSRFKQAARYARQAAKTQPIYAQLAKGTTKNAYNIALSDWFNPPVIHNIVYRDGSIRIDASDNVKVSEVRVRILDGDGKILEKGQAVQKNPVKSPRSWEYTPEVAGRTVEVEALDLAGNVTKQVA